MDPRPQVKFKKLDPGAKCPTYAHPGDSGADLYALKDTLLPMGVPTPVETGLAIELPPGYEAQVRCRSSMGKKGIMLANGIGTVDGPYRGNLLAMLVNFAPNTLDHIAERDTDGAYLVKAGDRIAQLVIVPVQQAAFEEVEELAPTDRGTGGFGSTGK